MIYFKWVEYKNIQSAGNHPIRVELDRSPTTLIGGENGAGKSNLLTALAYCLFGTVLSGAKLSDIINNINKKALLTKVCFEKNGVEWIVIRGEKPKKFELWKDDEKLDQYANSRDQQKFLETIMGMDYKIFTQIVLLNKEKYVPFMECSAGDRRKIVEDVLDISIFSYMNDECKAEIKSIDRNISNLTSERRVIQEKVNGRKELIEETQKQIKKKEESNNEIINDMESKIKTLEGERDVLDQDLSNVKVNGLDKLKKQKADIDKISYQYDSNVKSNSKLISFFRDNDICPTCDQDISDKVKKDKIELYENKNKEIAEISKEMMTVLEDILKKEKDLQKKQDKISEIRTMMTDIDKEIKLTRQSINSILSRSDSTSDNQTLDRYTTELEEWEDLLEKNSENLDKHEQKLELYELVRMMLKDDGVKAVIIKDYINIINKKINEFLNSMNFYINMTLDENFKETFHAINKENFSYKLLSTGQKTRVNLAIWLAFLEVGSIKNSVVTNLIFLDEILENLDANGVNDFMTLCRERLETKNIFVITQRFEEFKDLFRSSIKFKLNNGFTEFDTND